MNSLRRGALLCGAAIGTFCAVPAGAADFTVGSGTTAYTTQYLTDPGDTGTIAPGGAIDVSGYTAYGVHSSGDANTVTNNGTVAANGASASGVFSTGAAATITNNSAISAIGESSSGIYSVGNDAMVVNRGAISGNADGGQYWTGIFSLGGKATIDNSGSIDGAGTYSLGIYAAGDDATVHNSGTITTSGDWGPAGISAAGNGAVVDNSGTIEVTGGSADHPAIGIRSDGEDAVIHNSGTVNVAGDGGPIGIASFGTGAVIDNGGAVDVTGYNSTGSDYAVGVRSTGSDAVFTNRGSIAVAGAYADGVLSSGDNFAFTNRGSIRAIGTGAWALDFEGYAPTVTLLPGTAIQGGIYFNDPSSSTLNIGTGLNTALTFVGGNVPATINTYGQPYVVNGATLAVVDPTGFAAADQFTFDFAGTLTSTLESRMAPVGDAGMTTGSLPGDAAPDRRGFWITGLGFYGDRQASAPLDGFDYGAFGLMAGVDRSLSASTLAGIFGGIAHGGVKTAAGSTAIDASGGFAGTYWSKDTGKVFAHLSVAAGGFANDSSRIVANNLVAGGLETASASYASFYVDPAVSFGLHRQVGAATVSPSLGLRYTGLYQAGYSESGSAADMTVAGRSAQTLDVRGEIRTDFAAQVSDAGVGRFDVRAGVDGLFSWSGGVDATLLATQIGFATSEPDAVARGFVGAGTTFTAANGLVFTADAEAGYDSADTVTLSARASLHKAF